MSALLNGINDRSSVVQKSFAFAIGHLVRVGKHTWIHISIKLKATTELQNITLFSPSDSQRQQCWETSAETKHLVSGKRGYEDFRLLKKESSVVINSPSCPSTTNWLDFLPLNTKEKKLMLLLMTKGNSEHGLSSFKKELCKEQLQNIFLCSMEDKVLWVWKDMKMVSSLPHLHY